MLSILAQAASGWANLDEFLFIAMPYAVIVLFLFATIRRFIGDKFTYSSYSSQFLENKHQFYVAVPWHFGIISLFLGHLIGFLVPRGVLWWNQVPLRLYIIELGALIFAVSALFGLVNAVLRRVNNSRVRIVTSRMDFIIILMLLFQVLSGMYVAVFDRWGTNWFAGVLAPWLWSLFKLNPDISAVRDLPLSVKLHIVGAFLIFAVFPFTRLVHVLVVPITYLWRLPQQVIWNRKGRTPSQQQ
ncbi:MAG: respiratory nitrate reductase subunit gamma [Planctomycetes bacterium]|nr:respiratory nitrate reductase subunit gamma [Planctomycetota bacterium]